MMFKGEKSWYVVCLGSPIPAKVGSGSSREPPEPSQHSYLNFSQPGVLAAQDFQVFPEASGSFRRFLGDFLELSRCP